MTKAKKKTVTGKVELNEEDLKDVTGGSSTLTIARPEKKKARPKGGVDIGWNLSTNKKE